MEAIDRVTLQTDMNDSSYTNMKHHNNIYTCVYGFFPSFSEKEEKDRGEKIKKRRERV